MSDLVFQAASCAFTSNVWAIITYSSCSWSEFGHILIKGTCRLFGSCSGRFSTLWLRLVILANFRYLDQCWHSQSTSNSIFFHWYIGQWSILQQAYTNSCNTVHDTGWLWLTFLPSRLELEHSMSYFSPCMSILCLAVRFLSFDSLCDFLCRTLDKISKLFLACRLCTFAVGSWLFLNFIIMD